MNNLIFSSAKELNIIVPVKLYKKLPKKLFMDELKSLEGCI